MNYAVHYASIIEIGEGVKMLKLFKVKQVFNTRLAVILFTQFLYWSMDVITVYMTSLTNYWNQ